MWFRSKRNVSDDDLRAGVKRLVALAESSDVQSPTAPRRRPFVLDGLPVERAKALEYVPYFRAVNLLASQSAEIIVSTVRVIDRDKKVVTTDLASRATALLQDSPDGVQSSQAWLRDLLFDLLIEGNALVYAVPGIGGNSTGTRYRSSLVRLNVRNATARFADLKVGWPSLVYQAIPFAMPIANTEIYSHRDIVHARWCAQNAIYTSTSSSSFMSPAPIDHLKKAIKIGLEADSWVGDFFDNAARNDLVVTFPDDMAEDDQKKFMKFWRRTETSKRWPVLTFGGATVSLLKHSPQDAQARDLREFQVQEIGRYYGIPAPLIGSHVTQWGSGIEQLARLGYRFGTRFPLSQLLDAFSFRLLPRHQRFEVDSMSEVKGDMSAMTDLISVSKPSPNGPAVVSRRELRSLLGLFGELDDDWEYEQTPSDVDNSEDADDNPPDEEVNEPNNRSWFNARAI